MNSDIINGLFEFGAIFSVMGHIVQLKKDKVVKGIYIPSIVFFNLWGFWNVYYYPSLGQTYSFLAGIVLVITNCFYLYYLMKYKKGSE